MASHVLEFVYFKLHADADRARFERESAAPITAFLARQPGFVRRQLSVAPTGEWLELVWWADRRSAEAGAEAFVASPETAAMMEAIDPASVVSHVLDPVEIAGQFPESARGEDVAALESAQPVASRRP